MSERRWRIGVVGLGAAAERLHLPAYARIPNLELVGAHDPARQPRLSCPHYDSVGALLAEARPDILAVLTPPDSHVELALAGLEAGCHVLCEKPVAPSLAEGRRLASRAAASDLQVVVNQEFRFMEIHQRSRDWIGRDGFGELLFLRAEQNFRTTAETEAGWRGGMPRRAVLEFGVHVLDLCRYFFASEPEALTAQMPRLEAGGGDDLLSSIFLEFQGGRAAEILLDRLTRGRHRYLELRLDGTEGSLETRLGGRAAVEIGLRSGKRPFVDLEIAPGGVARLYRGERSHRVATDPVDLFSNATRRLVEAMLEGLEAGLSPPCSLDDHLMSLRLVEAAYLSANSRRRIVLDEMDL